MTDNAVIVEVEVVLCYGKNSPFDVPTYAFGQGDCALSFCQFRTVFLKPREAAANSTSLRQPLLLCFVAKIAVMLSEVREDIYTYVTNLNKPL